MPIQKTFLILFFCFLSFRTFSQSATGSIAANAKYLAIDKFDDFSDGFAIITNENSNAIINEKGEIVVPFKKYRFESPFCNGFIQAEKVGGTNYGYLNKKMEPITPFIFVWQTRFDKDGYVHNRKDKSQNENFDYNISSTGQMVPLLNRINGARIEYYFREMGAVIDYSEGLVKYSVKGKDGRDLYGYISRSSKIVIPAKYLNAGEFNEGLAPVAQLTDNGEVKWGFIDKTGKLVIPLQFRNQPGGFSNGLCYVKPVSFDEFNFAYINKAGEVQFKVKFNEANKLTSDFNFSIASAVNSRQAFREYNDRYKEILNPFQGKFLFWGTSNAEVKMISKTGEVTDFCDFLAKNGFPSKRNAREIIQNKVIRDERIIFKHSGKIGIINTDGNIVIAPVFSQLGHFDPVSKLAYALFEDAKGTTEGYINESGVFTIVKQGKSGL